MSGTLRRNPARGAERRSSAPGARREEPRRQAMERRFRAVERRHYWAGLLVASALCGVGLFHTWTRVAVLERSRELGEAKRDGERLASELTKLNIEAAALQNVLRVDAQARTRLNMAPPSPDRLILLETQAPERIRRVPEASRLEVNARIPTHPHGGAR